jgi:uncharacterized membrane protein|tara:strand:- start:256 stop:474 length:219 start_codon:yes stop_codon:yes gene_type:complete
MDWQIPLAVGNIVVVVGGVVWAFARLSASMATLTRSIERLDSTVEKLAKHSVEHEIRIAALESRSVQDQSAK